MEKNIFEDSLENINMPCIKTQTLEISSLKPRNFQDEIDFLKIKHEREKSLILQEASLKYFQYEARIESLKCLIKRIKLKIDQNSPDIIKYEENLNELVSNFDNKLKIFNDKLNDSEQKYQFEIERSNRLEKTLILIRDQNLKLNNEINLLKMGEPDQKAEFSKKCEEISSLQNTVSELQKSLENSQSENEKKAEKIFTMENLVSEYKKNEEHLRSQIATLESLLRHSKYKVDYDFNCTTLKKSATTSKLTNDLESPNSIKSPHCNNNKKNEKENIKELKTQCNLPLQYKNLQKVLKRKSFENYVPDQNDKLDQLFAHYIKKTRFPLTITKLGIGQYQLGPKRIYASIQNDNLVVRVGGGYMLVEDFLTEFFPANDNKMMSKSQICGNLGTMSCKTLDILPSETNNNMDMPKVMVKRMQPGEKMNERSRSPIGSVNGTHRGKIINESSIISIKSRDGKLLKQVDAKGKITEKRPVAITKKCMISVNSDTKSTPRVYTEE